MHVFDEYGFKSSDLAHCRDAIEIAIGIKFEEHWSSYRGAYFSAKQASGESYLIQMNYVDVNDEGWTFEEHSDMGVVLFASHLNDADGVRNRIERAVPVAKLLYRSIVYDVGVMSRFRPTNGGFQSVS